MGMKLICKVGSLPLSTKFTINKALVGIAEPGSVELTDDEVITLVEKMGFRIETRVSDLPAPYIQDPQSMLQNTYQASHWIARKL